MENNRGPVKFEDFIQPSNWKDLDTHLRTSSDNLEENIKETSQSEQSLRVQAREYLQTKMKIKKVSDKDLKTAEDLLFNNQVCAADGTYTSVGLSTTGIKGQIGIVTTSYINKRTDYVSHFFEPLLSVTKGSFEEVLEAKRSMDDDAISPSHIRAIMLYMERKKVLERSEPWKLLNGDVFPYDIRTGQGRLRGLKSCLDLGRELLKNEFVIAVSASSKDYVLNTLALGLDQLEYVDVKSYKDELVDFLSNAHFNDGDMKMSQDFANTYGDCFRVGIYKAKKRPYIFYCHKDSFDMAAAIIMRDSLFQPTRGYPLLIDYADSICTRLISASDFNRQITVKMAKHGFLEEQADEHSLRRR